MGDIPIMPTELLCVEQPPASFSTISYTFGPLVYCIPSVILYIMALRITYAKRRLNPALTIYCVHYTLDILLCIAAYLQHFILRFGPFCHTFGGLAEHNLYVFILLPMVNSLGNLGHYFCTALISINRMTYLMSPAKAYMWWPRHISRLLTVGCVLILLVSVGTSWNGAQFLLLEDKEVSAPTSVRYLSRPWIKINGDEFKVNFTGRYDEKEYESDYKDVVNYTEYEHMNVNFIEDEQIPKNYEFEFDSEDVVNFTAMFLVCVLIVSSSCSIYCLVNYPRNTMKSLERKMFKMSAIIIGTNATALLMIDGFYIMTFHLKILGGNFEKTTATIIFFYYYIILQGPFQTVLACSTIWVVLLSDSNLRKECMAKIGIVTRTTEISISSTTRPIQKSAWAE